MQTMMHETVKGVDKIKRYGWKMKDEPGTLKNLPKSVLQVHPDYQRDVILPKVIEITANWSWVGAGAIVVGERNGEFWVIDGQHRVLAAKRRSDITHLPCIVFQTEGVKQEAIGFLDLNTSRKPVNSIGKFKAMLAAGDESAIAVHRILKKLGITLNPNPKKAKELGSVGWAIRRVREDAEKLEIVMRVACDLSHDMPIREKLLEGLWYIENKLSCGISDKRFNDRLHAVGARRLIDGANSAAAFFVRGGGRTWAIGMLEVINKGLRSRFVLDGEDEN